MFTTFRSFHEPHFNVIQRNAIGSWLQLNPKPEILVMGNDQGTPEICQEFGLRHVNVKYSPQGTPMLDDMFHQADTLASHKLLCVIASDIILLPGTLETVTALQRSFPRGFVATLRRRDKDIRELIDFNDPNWVAKAREGITLGHPGAGDFFLFTKGFYRRGILPFTIGRASSDNWLIHEAVQLGVCCDCTDAMEIIHQKHDYPHVAGGFWGMVAGEEFKENRAMAAGKMLEIIETNWVMNQNRVPRRRS